MGAAAVPGAATRLGDRGAGEGRGAKLHSGRNGGIFAAKQVVDAGVFLCL